MEIDMKKHRARRGLVMMLELFAVIVWFGGVLSGIAASGRAGLSVAAAAVIAGFLLAALAAILESVNQTRYLTALIAKRLIDESPASPEVP